MGNLLSRGGATIGPIPIAARTRKKRVIYPLSVRDRSLALGAAPAGTRELHAPAVLANGLRTFEAAAGSVPDLAGAP
jgi:hypothetical protein